MRLHQPAANKILHDLGEVKRRNVLALFNIGPAHNSVGRLAREIRQRAYGIIYPPPDIHQRTSLGPSLRPFHFFLPIEYRLLRSAMSRWRSSMPMRNSIFAPFPAYGGYAN